MTGEDTHFASVSAKAKAKAERVIILSASWDQIMPHSKRHVYARGKAQLGF